VKVFNFAFDNKGHGKLWGRGRKELLSHLKKTLRTFREHLETCPLSLDLNSTVLLAKRSVGISSMGTFLLK
jgi:hypothetical protein